MKAPVIVIGIGNSLMGDDAAGLEAVKLLEKEGLPSWMETEKAGVPDVDLLNLLEGRQMAILVDAMSGGLPPGTITKFTLKDLPAATALPWSIHGFGLVDVLGLGNLIQPEKMPPHLWLVGIQASRMEPGDFELSTEVALALPEAVRVVRELAESADGI